MRRGPLFEGVKQIKDQVYATAAGKPLKLDLYLPEQASKPMPLVIWVHGGGWRNGSKESFRPAAPLLQKGYAVASINYRLTDEAIFPAQIEDCKAAVRWLRAHAKEYDLDPDHFGVWGSSAGGHLVALMGTSGSQKEWDKGDNADVSSKVQAVCDYYGPTDLLKMGGRHDSPQSPESLLIGGSIQENKQAADKANPMRYIGRDCPPFLIVHGDSDPTVPVEQSRMLLAALEQAKVPVTLEIIPGAGHGGPEFTDRERIEKVTAFFDEHLKTARGENPR